MQVGIFYIGDGAFGRTPSAGMSWTVLVAASLLLHHKRLVFDADAMLLGIHRARSW